MRRVQVAVLISAAAFWLGASAAGQIAPRGPEQTSFSAEDSSVRRPVTIPPAVMALIENDSLVRDTAQYENTAVGRVPASWFSASAIHLGSDGSSGLIVAAEGPLAGGNVETFWVVLRMGNGYRIVLAIAAHDLDVQRDRTHGYRNIRASAETCCTITTAEFRFDGIRYRRAWSKTENIP